VWVAFPIRLYSSLSLSIREEKREIYIYCRRVGHRRSGPSNRPSDAFIHSRRPDFGIHSVVGRCIYMSWPRAIITNISTRLLGHTKPSSPCVLFSSLPAQNNTYAHAHTERLRKLAEMERHRQRAKASCASCQNDATTWVGRVVRTIFKIIRSNFL
jgi:hypothetical protein